MNQAAGSGMRVPRSSSAERGMHAGSQSPDICAMYPGESRSVGLVGVVAPGRMGTDSLTENLGALSDADLDALLERLVSEEQVTSKRRETLHNRIEFVAAGGGAASADQAADQLATLRESERQVSDRRLILHRRIDELRAERSRRQALGVGA
jgi:hypothetical protein